MEAVFYNNTKRLNSTKLPTGLNSRTVSFVYKEASSIHNPVLLLNADVSSYNYCRIGDRYFYVTDCISVKNNLWEIHLRCDVLASYRADILATKALCLRSTIGYDDAMIDPYIVTTGEYSRKTNSYELTGFSPAGEYVLTVVSNESSSGFSAMYCMSEATLTRLVNALVGFDDNILTELAQVFGSAYDSIVECAWYPFAVSSMVETTPREITLGRWPTGVTGGLITNPVGTMQTLTCEIPWIYNNFRRLSPYSELYLYIPSIGLTSLNTKHYYQGEYMTLRLVLDIASGNLTANVNSGSAAVTVNDTISANVKVTLPVKSQNAPNATSMIPLATSMLAMFAGTISPLTAITAGAATAFNIAAQPPSIVGGFTGSMTARKLTPHSINVIVQSQEVNPAPSTLYPVLGGAARRVFKLSSLVGGYVQTQDVSVSANADYVEVAEINNLLNGGVYLE